MTARPGIILLTMCAVLLSPVTRAHAAGGFNFAWNQCWSEGGTAYAYFACNANVSGPVAVAVGSFKPTADMPDFDGIQATVHLQSSQSTLPDWWQFFNAGSCRLVSLTASADFTGALQTSCVDPFGGLAAGGIASYRTATTGIGSGLSPDYAIIAIYFAIADPEAITAADEYDGFALAIHGQKTVGAGSCAGCSVPVCVGLTRLDVVGSSGSRQTLLTPLQNQFIGWQCGQTTATVPYYFPPGQSITGTISGTCAPNALPCAAVPVRNITWGRILEHYR